MMLIAALAGAPDHGIGYATRTGSAVSGGAATDVPRARAFVEADRDILLITQPVPTLRGPGRPAGDEARRWVWFKVVHWGTEESGGPWQSIACLASEGGGRKGGWGKDWWHCVTAARRLKMPDDGEDTNRQCNE